MDFDDTASAYPTDGVGGSGTGSLATASHLKDATSWIVDRLVVKTVGAAGRLWTLKDSGGSTIWSITIPTTRVVGDVIELGFQISSQQGFTMESANADCTGSILYRIVRDIP